MDEESTSAMFLRHIDGLHKRLEGSRSECESLYNRIARLEMELRAWEQAFPSSDGPPPPAKHVEASAKLGGW